LDAIMTEPMQTHLECFALALPAYMRVYQLICILQR
jgi:hypothetical protein